MLISPPDRQLGETVRILYMHVPTVSAAYLAFVITAVASVAYLVKRTEFWTCWLRPRRRSGCCSSPSRSSTA
ncbi:MAG: cytochrome c biogenesis protein CcsA [Microthrixaceae bacterium]